jgi:hypothetical protein
MHRGRTDCGDAGRPGLLGLGCYGAEIETPHIDGSPGRGCVSASSTTRPSANRRASACSAGCTPTKRATESGPGGDVRRIASGGGLLHGDEPANGTWRSEPTERGLPAVLRSFVRSDEFLHRRQHLPVGWPALVDFGDDFYTTDAFTDYAIRYVDQALDRQQPFLIYIAHNAPHYPLQAPGSRRDEVPRPLPHRLGQAAPGPLPAAGCDGDDRSEWPLSPRPDYIPAWDSLNEQQQDWEISAWPPSRRWSTAWIRTWVGWSST